MPLASRKFCVYVGNSFDASLRITNRLVVNNFRVQEKSIGSASFTLKRKVRIDTLTSESVVEDEIKVGMFVKITYWTPDAPVILGTPTGTLWYGTISGIVEDKFAGLTDDSIGFVTGSEIGIYFSKLPMTFARATPVFNPVADDYFLLNKKIDAQEFEKKDVRKYKVSEISTATVPEIDRPSFWSREEVILFVCSESRVGGASVKWPWTSGNKALYKTFTDKTRVTSFPSPDGMSLTEFLDGVIESPFTYHFNYTRSFAIELVITCKSLNAILGVCSFRADGIEIETEPEDKNNTVTNFSISRSDDTYDVVKVRGSKILWYGALSPFNYNSAETLTKGWTQDQEQIYVNGYENTSDLPVPGTLDDAANQSFVTETRKQLWKPYRFFKWPTIAGGEWLTTTYSPGEPEEGTIERIPFCGTTYFVETAGVYAKDPSFLTTMETGTVPSKSSIQWADKLPLNLSAPVNPEIGDERVERLSAPLVLSRGVIPGKTDTYYFVANSDPFRISYKVDGILIDRAKPQMSAMDDMELFRFGGILKGRVIPVDWTDALAASPNPTTRSNTLDARVGFQTDYEFTNYATFIACVACYSEQYLEAQVTRSVSGDMSKIKIIEDPALQLWVAQKGAVKKLINKTFTRFESTTVLRNDFPKLLETMESAKAWFFTDKKSVKLDYMLINYVQNPEIGTLILGVKETLQDVVVVNTTISSIEWDAGDGQPRVIISTEIPEMPLFTRMQTQQISPSYPQSFGDTFAPSREVTPRSINAPEQPVTGELFASTIGGAGNAKTNIYVVEGGNVVAPVAGMLGIKLISNVPSTFTQYNPNTYPTTEDGLGYVRSIDDGTMYRFLNAQPYSNQGLIRGQRILSYNTVSIATSGGSLQDFLTFGASF